MANYNCTPAGCTQDPSGIYPSLAACQAACFKWGCPNTIDADANLYFIYDLSGSFDIEDVSIIYTAATAYTATLTAAGWQGNEYHVLCQDEMYVRWPAAIYQTGLVRQANADNTNLGSSNCNSCFGCNIPHGADFTNGNGGYYPNVASDTQVQSNNFYMFDVGPGTGQFDDLYGANADRFNPFNPTKNLNQIVNGVPVGNVTCPGDPSKITGFGVGPASKSDKNVVVMFIDHSASLSDSFVSLNDYDSGFVSAYPDPAPGMVPGTGCFYNPPPGQAGSQAWYQVYSEFLKYYGNVGPYAGGIGFVNYGAGFNYFEGWDGNSPKPEYTQAYMQHWATYSAVTAAGGQLKSVIIPGLGGDGAGFPGNTDGSWTDNTGSMIGRERKFALQITAQIDPGNKPIHDGTWLTNTAPGTPGGVPTIANLGHSQSTDSSIYGSFCAEGAGNPWYTCWDGFGAPGSSTIVAAPCPFGLELDNPYWSNTNDYSQISLAPNQGLFAPSILGPDYADAGGNLINPDTGLAYTTSPTGNWGNLAAMDWSYSLKFSGITGAFLASELNSLLGPITVPNNLCISAETSGTLDYPYPSEGVCDTLCDLPTGANQWYNCEMGGCLPTSVWGPTTLINYSACTAQCTSYTCTITGCSLENGTGGTTTLTGCTDTCTHWECTDNCGCVEVPGYGDLSLDYVYANQSQCEEDCVAWKCYNNLGITLSTKLYIIYDTSSMNINSISDAYFGLQDFLNANDLEDIQQQHISAHNERWLGWHMVPYGIRNIDGTNSVMNGYIQSATLWSQWLEEDFIKWAYGAESGLQAAYGLPNPLHFGSVRNNPATPMTTNTSGIGQPTTASFINNNTLNPNYALGANIHPQFWVQTASTSDDVIMLIFADESESSYHGNSYSSPPTISIGNAPYNKWKDDYNNFLNLYDVVNMPCTGTSVYSGTTLINPPVSSGATSGGTGSFKAFIYPTRSNSTVSTKNKIFDLNVLAGISVGNLLNVETNTPFNGVWSAGTAPRQTGSGVWNENNSMDSPGTPGYAPFNMATGNGTRLEDGNPYMSVVNPNSKTYSAGTGTSVSAISLNYGGLELMGWGMNQTFPAYNAGLFSNDLTEYLSGTTVQYPSGTTCISAQTLVNATWPHLSESACTATCANYDCSDTGCIINASNGQFGSLEVCTAACQSYSCTVTGCSLYNVPYIAAGGVIDYSTSWGSGGTYFNTLNSTALGVLDAQLSCTTNCEHFSCDWQGCTSGVGPAGPGQYNNLNDCISACTTYDCVQTYVDQTQGAPQFTGWVNPCDPIPNDTGAFTNQNDCLTGCTSYMCGDIGCYQVNNPNGDYLELSACTAQCQSTECTNGGCVDQIGSGGTFFNLTSFALATASCVTNCVSYNCGPTGCTTQVGTGGTYTTSAACTASCASYNCESQGCLEQAGSGGTYFNETSLADALTACTAQCTSWECGTFGCYEDLTGTGGTYSSLTQCQEVCTSWDCGPDGCGLFNQPPNPPNANLYYYGTGGQYATSGACSAACISFDCVPATSSTVSGCIELAGTGHTYPNYYDCTGTCKTYTCSANGCIIQPNSGGTYPFTPLGLLQCESACTSYNCGASDCTPVVGSGGTFFSATNSYFGYTACTASCSSYNCYSTGCTIQIGTGGTYSALTSCTASCLSWECTQNCCEMFNVPFYGTGGTYTTSGNCHTDCVHWGCFAVNTGITLTTSKIYAYYDTTSMSQTALQDAILGMEAWISTLPGFSGNLYHTLINDERWLGWATSVYTGAFAAGNTSSVIDNSNAGLIYQWAAPQGILNIYDNCIPGTQFPFLNPPVFANGPAPTAANTDDVIVVAFIDEAAEPNFGPLASPSITQYVYHGDDMGCVAPCIEPQYAGLVANTLHDQPTETWRQDYTAFTTSYNAVTAATGTFNALLYPTEGSSYWGGQPISDRNRIFALHAVATISKGNMTVGLQGENWLPGTAPRTAASGGMSVGTPPLCAIADLTALEVSNPYVLQGYGNLRDKGWNYNIGFSAYTSIGFDTDMTEFLAQTTTSQGTGGTQCLSACTSMSNLYPFATFAECTGQCASYECTVNGCVVSPNTGGTFSSLQSCTGACISWSCTTTGATSVVGTGATGTHTDYNVVASGCNSFNCLYDPSGPSNQQGCQQQIGSGGTYVTFSACTADCRSWECVTDCLTNATGCTEHPNTGHTYSSLTACTGDCQVNWYCVPETIINSCGGQQIISQINNEIQPWTPSYNAAGYGFLGYMGDPANATNHQYDTFSNFSFSMSLPQLQSYLGPNFTTQDLCDGPPIQDSMGPGNIPGYLVTLDHIVWDIAPANGPLANWFPMSFTDWATMISYFITLGANVNLGMQPHAVFAEIQGTFASNNNQNLEWSATFSPCLCLPDPCYTLCDNGITPIPGTAIGPFTTSGAAENACCFTATSWNCSAGTILDTCSGRTQINFPNQFATSEDAWDWLTVNSPASNLDTLKYESTTPAFGVDDVCVGPNGGILYEILPMSSPYVNNNLSYATWDGFIAQLQAEGVTGILSGMSYSIVNAHFMAQSGHSLATCVSLCTCREEDCHCIEVLGTGGTYATSGLCYSACCTGATGTSWECVSGQSMTPICNTKTHMGTLNSPWYVLDNFRVNAPASYFASKKYVSLFDSFGFQTATYTWNDVWSSISATTTPWEDCYEYVTFSLGWPYNQSFTGYKKREYVSFISHPLVSGGLEYHTWNDFYTAAATVTTLNTGMSVSGVCTALGNIPGTGGYDCTIGIHECCSARDCYCYELFTTGGTYTTEPDCLSACCPTTGWTCYSANSIPQGYCINVTNPTGTWFQSQADCQNSSLNRECFPIETWKCVTGITINSCDPSINLYNTSPAIAANNIQYPFTSTTADLNGPVPNYPVPAPFGQGQVETILTDHNYLYPDVDFSAVTFEYCSGTTASCTGVTNCFGPASNIIYGANSYPTYRMVSIAHPFVSNQLPYSSWSDFVIAAQAQGYNITTGMSASYLHDNTIFSQYTFVTELEPCTCYFDANACDCIPSNNPLDFATSAACEAVCCPSGTPITYDCTINGCVDPGNGLGAYTLNQYNDCVNECQEYICVSGDTILDSCSGTTDTIPPGANSIVGALLPQYSTSWPYMQTKYDALQYFGDTGNGLQGATFDTYKWDCTVGCGTGWGVVQNCLAPYGVWARLEHCYVKPIGLQSLPMWNGPYTNWTDMLLDLNANGYAVNSAMDLDQIQIILSGNPTSQHLELFPVSRPCVCAETDCGCVLSGGTGHTGGYSITQSALCESICCSAACIDECGVLICGEQEGVLYYDHGANTTVKLFDDTMYQFYDVAARQNKIWLYNLGTIHEWNVSSWCPFTKVFNRAIGVGQGVMGRGLTPTNSPYKLLTASDKVYELDISGGAAISTPLYNIPSGLTCTGDIVWDEGSGGNPAHTIITYGSGSTYYVGKFTHPAGTLLEFSQITGLNAGESMDSLYGVNDTSTQIFGITTDRRVFELMTNLTPLEFAPVPTQTLTLQNQITNLVNGATNVSFGGGIFQHSCTKIESNEAWYCMDIFGCQSFLTPPSNYVTGPFTTQLLCEAECNFGCDCQASVGSPNTPCLCSLYTGPINPLTCDWYPNLASCQAALPPAGAIQPGSGCCDCYGCDSLTYELWISPSVGTNTQTMSTVAVPSGGVPTWVPGQSYYPREVVLYTDDYGNECCYVRVLDYCNPPCPWDVITPWESNRDYVNSLALNTYLNPQHYPWIACDPDCPTIISYDCITGTTGSSVLHSGCGSRNTIPPQVFTTNIATHPQSVLGYIANGANGLQNTNLTDIRYVVNNAPSTNNPCTDTAPIAPSNSIYCWWAINYVTSQINVNPNGATGTFTDTTWAGFVTQLANIGIEFNGDPVDLTMTNTEVFAGINQTGQGSLGWGMEPCYCRPGEECHCEEVIGSGGTYLTSAACETVCCSGSTWSCDTITQQPISDTCTGTVDTGVTTLNFSNQINAIAAMGFNGWWGSITAFKYQMAVSPIAGAQVGTYQGQPLIPLALGDTSCPSPFPGSWARIVELSCSVYPYDITGGGYTGGPPFTQWGWFIQALNDNAATYNTGHVFHPSMTWQQIQHMAPHIEAKWEYCVCEMDPCRGTCVELFDGTGNHSTEAECLTACCPTYDCTMTGCFNPGTGLGAFSSLTQCEAQCQQYECQSGGTTPIAPCSNLTSIPLGGGSNFMNAGSQYDMLAYFADPQTPPIVANVNNMQGQPFADYKGVIQGIVPPFTQNCEVTFNMGWPLNTTYLLGYQGYLTHVDLISSTTGAIVAGPFTDWVSIIQHLNVNLGLPVSLSFTFEEVQDTLIALHDSMLLEPSIDWCECISSHCDCILIPGTGATPYDITQYSQCYSACCDETYDCTDTGCIPNSMGTGQFTSLGQCQAVCVEFECISAVTAVNCEMKLPIPVQNCQPLPNGYGTLVNNLLAYFSNQANSVTWTNFNTTKYDQSAPSIFNNQTPLCNSTCNQGVWHYFDTISMSNDLNPSHPYYINTGPCTSWGDFINQVNLQPGINNYLMVNYSPNVSSTNLLHDVWSIPFNSDTVIRVSELKPCICIDEPCHCNELVGTGRTPTQNYYPTSAACESNCCDDQWYCNVGAVPIGPHGQQIATQPCVCLQGNIPAGVTTYPTELDCKQDTHNCCLPQWYDCPNGACVSLIPGVVGPYSTPQQCNAAVLAGECGPVEDGYNCIITPGPALNICQPCVGTMCQYTPTTAAGPPFFGNALSQCQSLCIDGNGPCWKCCLTQNGWIYQLLLTTNPCVCPEDTIEVPCDGHEPCPYPVSCIPGYTYSWVTCQCECDPQECPIGYYWNTITCTCVPDIHPGPIDVVREEAQMVVELSEYYNRPIPVIAKELSEAVDKLKALQARGFKGDDCDYCVDDTHGTPVPGVCLYNGCLSSIRTETFEESLTKIICYVDGLPIYSAPDGAEDLARKIGCSGVHQTSCTGKATAGPCICRNWQTQPDGSNKCIEWSPAGCGDDAAVGYMPCPTHAEAVGKFDDLKITPIVSNKDPELYKFIREINKLQPKAPPKPIVSGPTSPFEIPTISDSGGSDSGGGSSEYSSCCEWCAAGPPPGTPPAGCSDHMCDRCYEDDRDLPVDDGDGRGEGREESSSEGDY